MKRFFFSTAIRNGLVLLVAALFFSCRSAEVMHTPKISADDVSETRYRCIFFVHGDNDYLYHDVNGNEIEADERLIEEAKTLATSMISGEVFIFHRKPKSRFLFLFTQDNIEAVYFKHGKLIKVESYRWEGESDRFSFEMQFLDENAISRYPMQTVFGYFGHEIPNNPALGYDQSIPRTRFSIGDIQHFLTWLNQKFSNRINLTILSTCYNGSVPTIKSLQPYTRYIVASPENLHLSYFSLDGLASLEHSLDSIPQDLPLQFAKNAFARLIHTTQTAVAITIYESDKLRIPADPLSMEAGIAEGNSKPTISDAGTYCDCADLGLEDIPSEGIEVLFRPARFGKQKSKTAHSGWACTKHSTPLSRE